MYTFSISVLVQALLIISISAAADHGHYRKTLLLVFAFIGAVATMLFLPVVPGIFMLGALLAIIANTSYGVTSVLLNSFLPLLVRYDSSIQYPGEASFAEFDVEGENEAEIDPLPTLETPLLQPHIDDVPQSSQTTSNALRFSTKISSYGIGIGYSK